MNVSRVACISRAVTLTYGTGSSLQPSIIRLRSTVGIYAVTTPLPFFESIADIADMNFKIGRGVGLERPPRYVEMRISITPSRGQVFMETDFWVTEYIYTLLGGKRYFQDRSSGRSIVLLVNKHTFTGDIQDAVFLRRLY